MTVGLESSRLLLTAAFVGCAVVVFGGSRVAGANHPHQSGLSDSLSFTKDIAPIVFERCSSCHRPGGSAPFDLLTYSDIHIRLPLIADVIARRYMPPWLPEPGFGEFVGERRLSDEEIDLISRWIDEGAVEGDPADLPSTPVWRDWRLGEPDLVIEMPPYTVPAQGRDVYRNLVAPIPVSQTRYVSAVELRWGDTRVVHHARMMVDTTRSSRAFDESDPAPGFDGMEIVSGADNPPGHFVGWAPGSVQAPGDDDMAWPLDPGTDLVLQLHLRPTGRPELVEPQVAFHFAERAPTKTPALIMLGSFDIDIPPGEKSYIVRDTYQLPVDVDALGVYPHAHYLGKQVLGRATLPDGTTKWLLRIDNWDFNSQDDYRYETPIFLPAGTTLTMQWTYDNTAENPFNPNSPPRRVVYGSLSSDEMADLVIQVLPRTESDVEVLHRDLAWHYETRDVLYLARQEHGIGDALASQGKFAEAVPHYQESLRLRSDDAHVLVGLAKAIGSLGDHATALTIAERAAQISGYEDPIVLDGLAGVYAAAGQVERAVSTAQRAIALAVAAGVEDLANEIRRHLARYRQRNQL